MRLFVQYSTRHRRALAGDGFTIKTSNIFATCESCSREFVMLERYLKTQGKKVKFIINADSKINNTRKLIEKSDRIAQAQKKYEKIYRKSKKIDNYGI